MRAFEELSEGDRLCFRALTLAARAAHIGNREEEAVTLFRRAEAIATSNSQLREARWGLLSSLSQMERRSLGSAHVATWGYHPTRP